MKKILTAFFLATMLVANLAHADGWRGREGWHGGGDDDMGWFGAGLLGGLIAGFATQPAYVQPAPPVYVQPSPPVYVQPAPPVYVQPAPAYVQPGYYGGYPPAPYYYRRGDDDD